MKKQDCFNRKIRIIDNKKIALTDDEYKLYQNICQSYNDEFSQGVDLFKGLFESDERGFICFLIPPKQLTTMEVWMFLVNIMVHQHLDTALNEVYQIKQDHLKMMQEAQNLLKQCP